MYVQQNGRSMIEMIGVISIIGILSATGLAGYNKAMYKHKMNQTVNIFTQLLERFAELEPKLQGIDELYEPEHLIKYGLISDCQIVENEFYGGNVCKLPTGFLASDIAYYNYSFNGHFDVIFEGKYATKYCIDFLSINWVEMIPEDWWSPEGFLLIWNDSTHKYLYSPYGAYNITKTSYTMSDIQDACSICSNTFCDVYFAFKGDL